MPKMRKPAEPIPANDQAYYNLWREIYEKRLAESKAQHTSWIPWQEQLDKLNAWATERGLTHNA